MSVLSLQAVDRAKIFSALCIFGDMYVRVTAGAKFDLPTSPVEQPPLDYGETLCIGWYLDAFEVLPSLVAWLSRIPSFLLVPFYFGNSARAQHLY